MADAVESLWQDMQQETANELRHLDGHGGVTTWPLDPIIFDLEGDAVLVGTDQADVGDCDTVGIAG